MLGPRRSSAQPVPPGPAPKARRDLTRDHDERFPLRRFTRCAVCGRAVTGSVSRGRNGLRYAFYHCTRGCVRLPKAALEQQFVELLDDLRPHPAYWKLLKAAVLDQWREAMTDARVARDRARRTLQDLEQKLSRLDDAYIYRHAIDERSYTAKRDELREAIVLETLHASDAGEAAMDVEGMLAFAEHTVTHASALWTAETNTARRVALQWALFPTGIRTGKNGAIETPVTYAEFYELRPRQRGRNGDGGPDRDRTGDLLNAIQARSQLRYRPTSGKANIYCNRESARRP